MRTRMIACTVLLLFACRHPSTSDRERPSTTVAPAPDTGTNQFFEPETFGEAPPDFSWWTSEPVKVHPKSASRDAETWWSWRFRHFEDHELAMTAPIISSQLSPFYEYDGQYSEAERVDLRDDLWVAFGAPFDHIKWHIFQARGIHPEDRDVILSYETDDFVFVTQGSDFMILVGPDALRESQPEIPTAYVPLFEATRPLEGWGYVTIHFLFPQSGTALQRTMRLRNSGSVLYNRRSESWP